MGEPTPTPEPMPTPAPEPTPAPTPEPAPNPEPTPKKAFTQADIDNAVAEARAQWEKQQSQAEKLAKMSAGEREKEQLRLDREQYEKDRAALDRQLLEQEAAKQLREKGVPESFAARVCGKDAEETKSNIDAFVNEWNAAVQAEINDKLKGKTPPAAGEHQGTDPFLAGFGK